MMICGHMPLTCTYATNCGKPRAYNRRGKLTLFCAEHAKSNKDAIKKRSDSRRAAGLCIQCGKVAIHNNSGFCLNHLTKRKKR